MHAYYITGFFFLKHEKMCILEKFTFANQNHFSLATPHNCRQTSCPLPGFSPESNRALADFPYFTACIHKDLIFFLLPFCNFLFIMIP